MHIYTPNGSPAPQGWGVEGETLPREDGTEREREGHGGDQERGFLVRVLRLTLEKGPFQLGMPASLPVVAPGLTGSCHPQAGVSPLPHHVPGPLQKVKPHLCPVVASRLPVSGGKGPCATAPTPATTRHAHETDSPTQAPALAPLEDQLLPSRSLSCGQSRADGEKQPLRDGEGKVVHGLHTLAQGTR